MHGKGTFYDPRLDDAEKFPVAARTRQGTRAGRGPTGSPPSCRRCTSTSCRCPRRRRPRAAFDARRRRARQALFNGKAKCATCHVPPLFTEPGWNLHTAEEIGIDDFQAKRSPDGRYRTTPLARPVDTDKIHKGGFYHDGRFADAGRRRRPLRRALQTESELKRNATSSNI